MITPSKEFLDIFKSTPGAISVCESIAIMNLAMNTPEGGDWITLGAHAGKDSMSAAYGIESVGLKGSYYMVDPCYDLKNTEAWEHTIQGKSENMGWPYFTEEGFYDKVKNNFIQATGGNVKPVLIGSYSEKEIPNHQKISWAFVDSDNHQPERVYAELELLKPLMVKGGIIAFHDFQNQYITPREAHAKLIESGDYENIPINWEEIFNYVRENDLENGNTSWHEKGSEEFPKFVGAVKRI